MTVQEFLRPDRMLIGLFILLVIMAFISLSSDYRLIPCQLVSDRIIDSTCSMFMIMYGSGFTNAVLTPFSYLVLAILLVGIPYLLACIVRAILSKDE